MAGGLQLQGGVPGVLTLSAKISPYMDGQKLTWISKQVKQITLTFVWRTLIKDNMSKNLYSSPTTVQETKSWGCGLLRLARHITCMWKQNKTFYRSQHVYSPNTLNGINCIWPMQSEKMQLNKSHDRDRGTSYQEPLAEPQPRWVDNIKRDLIKVCCEGLYEFKLA